MKQEKDIKIVSMMIDMYCHGVHHSPKHVKCQECTELFAFVVNKRSKCPYGDDKDYCSQCQIKCYQSNGDMRSKIKKVMRYAAPRMMFTHPILSCSHLHSVLKGKRKAKKAAKKAKKELAV